MQYTPASCHTAHINIVLFMVMNLLIGLLLLHVVMPQTEG